MSGDTIAVELQERTVVRKGLQGLRASGLIPAVIHDHGNPSIHVMGDFTQLSKIYSAAGKHHPVQLTVGKQQHLVMIKDVDFEPAKHRMRHIVFQAIKQNEETEAEVPITFKEVEIPAEKLSLLVLKQLDRVQVKALPKDLPDELVLDPGKLTEVGDHLTVADLEVPQGVTVLTDPVSQIAIVEMPKDQVAEADAAAEALAEDKGAPEESAEGGEASADEKPAEGDVPKEPTEEE
jgi:large subunit ribosomal protein L25